MNHNADLNVVSDTKVDVDVLHSIFWKKNVLHKVSFVVVIINLGITEREVCTQILCTLFYWKCDLLLSKRSSCCSCCSWNFTLLKVVRGLLLLLLLFVIVCRMT